MKKILILLFVLVSVRTAQSQSSPAFSDDIKGFQKADSESAPLQKQTLFIGSSSFTRWTKVNEDFAGAKIINRAFGGSTLPDLIRYFYEVVYPYNPSKIFIYCGENDLASSDTVSAQTVALRFRTLYQMIITNFPSVKIYFVSIKPSPSRESIQRKVIKANMLIKQFLGARKNSGFIDIYNDMLDSKGKMREDLYVEDRLHMNTKGYAIWIRKMKPFVYEKVKIK
jgi:lysophospholipase L1-like esterase